MTAKSWLTILTLFVPSWTYAATQAHLIQLVQQAPTVTTVRSPGGSALAATGIALGFQVTSTTGLVVPDGRVTLSDNATVLESVPVINGTATLTEALSFLGIHKLVACYSGDGNFLPSCSSPLDLTALPPYTLQQSKPSAIIESSKTFTDKLSIIPAKGFVGIVQLACQVPSDRCALSPSSVYFSGDGRSQAVEASFIPSATSAAVSFIALPLIGLIGLELRRKNDRWRAVVSLVALTALLGLAGCGPVVSFPLDTANLAMRVNASSGAYSQAVVYQIQVDTIIAKP